MLKMQYKSFVWPNNPQSYTLRCERQFTDLHADGVVYRVRNGREHRAGRRLADAKRAEGPVLVRRLEEVHLHLQGHVHTRWKKIIGKAVVYQPPRFRVFLHILEESLSQSHGYAAFDLAGEQHGVDDLSAVVHRHIAEHIHRAELGIHLHFGDVRAEDVLFKVPAVARLRIARVGQRAERRLSDGREAVLPLARPRCFGDGYASFGKGLDIDPAVPDKISSYFASTPSSP